MSEPILRDFDADALMARLRAGDEAAIERAYKMTFAGEVGRFVLAHIMAQGGVGQIQGPNVIEGDRHYLAGRHDHALEVHNRCGFDQPHAIVQVLTDTILEGTADERDSEHGYDPDLGDGD